jgi:hypothetical protein
MKGTWFWSLGFLLAIFMGLTPAYAQIFLKFQSQDPHVYQVRSAIAQQQRLYAPVALQKKVNLIIVGPDVSLESESSIGVQIERIKKIVAGPVYYRRVNTAEEFWRALVLQNDEYIQSLFILAVHGSNGGSGSQPVLSLYNNRKNGSDEFIFWDEFATKSHLKFMPDALVVFGSCSIIPGLNEIQGARKYFENFAGFLGMHSGWIFGAYTSVTNSIDYFFKTPANEYGWHDPQGILATQVIAPFSFFKFLIDDRFRYNQGYLYGFSEHQEVMLKTHFYKARQGIIDGQKVYPQ